MPLLRVRGGVSRCGAIGPQLDRIKKPGRESHTFVNTKTSSKIVYLRMDCSPEFRSGTFASLVLSTCIAQICLRIQKSRRKLPIERYNILVARLTFRDNFLTLGTNGIRSETGGTGIRRAEIERRPVFALVAAQPTVRCAFGFFSVS